MNDGTELARCQRYYLNGQKIERILKLEQTPTQTAQLYDAETQRPFRDGQRVLSVTDVLKINGLYDGFPVDEYFLWMGQARHKAIELLVRGELDIDKLHVDLIPSVNAYIVFEKATGFKPYRGAKGSEVEFWNEQLKLATRLDLLGQFPDKTEAIVELKSGSIGKPTALQTAGQDITMGGPRRKRYGLSVPKTGAPSVRAFTSSDDYSKFVSCLNVAHLRIEHFGVKL